MPKTLSVFDAINIAHCAMRRADQNSRNTRRFKAEFSTVMLWKNCQTFQHVTRDGQILHINTSNL
jgi:predicted membrane protein